MHRARLGTILTLSTVTLAGWPGIARADRVIDSFREPLPPQVLPDDTESEVLWVGTFPTGVFQSQDGSMQGDLTEVLGGERDTTLTAYYSQSLVEAYIADGSASYSTDELASGNLVFEYGGLYDLDADLTQGGGLAFELEIDYADDDVTLPVELTIAVTSQSGAGYDEISLELLGDGVYQLPFSDFVGVDFTDVDALMFSLDGSCAPGIDFDLVGGLRTTSCLQLGTPLADIALDTFQAPLPGNELPYAGPFSGLWVGTLGAFSQSQWAEHQVGIDGVLGGERETRLRVSDIANFITAVISNAHGTPMLGYSTAYPTSGYLNLHYPMQQAVDLGTMQAFELEIEGDMDDGLPRPVDLQVVVSSGDKNTKSTTIEVLDDGVYTVPFSAFPGVDFSAVNEVRFRFDASDVQAIDFGLYGGLRATACVP